MNESINKEILRYLPYPSLFEKLEAYKLLDNKESTEAKKLLDLPCILYILNLPEFELFKIKSLKSKDLWLDVKKFVRKELPRINYYYEGGIYLYLKEGKIDDTALSSELKPSSSFGLQFKKDRETGEEYLLLTKIIRKTDSPSELHPDPDERKQMLEDYKDFFIINKDEVRKTIASTRRLLLFILKEKLQLSQEEIEEWFKEYGFSGYPEYQHVSDEITRYKELFKSRK
jgi:hypothetical protein